jgi:hypothetical protein
MDNLDISHAVEAARIRIAELEAKETLDEYEVAALEAHKTFVANFD